jgi:hypothetical protein
MSVVRYRKLPVVVDTVQWTGHNLDELVAFTDGLFIPVDPGEGLAGEYTGKVFDALHSTWVLVKTGQHVVRGVLGEFYPIAEDVLAETYELVEEPAPDTFPAWLAQRFDPNSPPWDVLDRDGRTYWQHEAAAVRRAVARGGFKTEGQ